MPRGIYIRTPEYRQKLRDAWYSSDKCAAYIKTLAEAAQTPEAKAKRSATLKKTLGTPEARRAKAEAATGRQVSDHTKEKIRRALDNLQVLTPRENLTKSDKFPLLQVPL